MAKNDRQQMSPLVSAAGINEGNYVRARFDNNLAWVVQEVGRRRAPNEGSIWRHTVGYAGEIVAAAYFGVQPNQTITEDYIGDDGYDLIHRGSRIEVKTVTRDDGLQLRVSQDKVECADYFVLARCSNPSELVELIGYIDREALVTHGREHPEGKICIGTSHLFLFEPIFLSPDRIREQIGAVAKRS